MLNSLNGNGLSNFRSQNPAPFLDQKRNPFTDFKTGLPLSSRIQPQPPRTGFGTRQPTFDPTTMGDAYTLGGNTYKVGGTGYGTKVFQQGNSGEWNPVTGNGTDPAALQLSAAIKDPRLASWLSTDDPSIKYDDLIRSTWAKDPTQALAVYGQQAARKPGGVDPTPDSAWFTDANYWPSVMAGFDGSTPALNQSVKELGTATPQNVAALNQWRADMSPGAQQKRNDPDKGFLGGLGPIATIASMIPGPWQVPAMALNAANSADQGNWGGAIASVMGMPGVGSGITNSLSNGLQGLGVASSVAPYVSKGLISAGGTALGGGSVKQSLTNGLATGLGTYGGNQIAGAIGDSLSPTISRALAQGTAGALGSAIKGGDVLKSGLLSGINGLAQGASSGMDNGVLKSLVKSSPGLLNTIMASQNRGSRSAPSAPAPQQARMPDWVRQAMVALGKKGYTEQQAKQMIQQRGRG